MDLESLKTKVTEAGGTQFSSLSERTINHMLEREIKRNGDDEFYTDDVINGIVADLKEMDGNLHFEVGRKNTEYRTNFEKDWNEKHKGGSNADDANQDALAKILARMDAQDQKLQEMETARKNADVKAEKTRVFESVKSALKSKFEQAGIEENSYILRQTLRDIEIPDQDANVKELVKEAESQYYKNLKEAGFEYERPRTGSSGGGKGKTAADDFFAKKASKEGWAKK